MMAYLMTHSLLSSWLYALKGNPYEDATTERDVYEEFLQVLRREPTATTEAMQKGIEFEDLVTSIVEDDADGMLDHPKWFESAAQVAEIVSGGELQYRAKKNITIAGMEFVLYGRLDCLKAGVVYDIKFSGSYDKGKYIDSTQHPTYLELIPEAHSFVYLVSNGTHVWKETYRRDETSDIKPMIADFITWLTANGLLELYKQHWGAL